MRSVAMSSPRPHDMTDPARSPFGWPMLLYGGVRNRVT